MLKRIAGLLAVMTLGAMLTLPAPARAEIQYPWCAEYGGRDYSGTNCGFTTLAQCRANVSGIGGFCYENPAYAAAPPRPKKLIKPR